MVRVEGNEETRPLLVNCFLGPGFLEPEEPGKVGVQNTGGRVWERV